MLWQGIVERSREPGWEQSFPLDRRGSTSIRHLVQNGIDQAPAATLGSVTALGGSNLSAPDGRVQCRLIAQPAMELRLPRLWGAFLRLVEATSRAWTGVFNP